MKNNIFQLPKMWPPLYPFNMYNIQNPKTHAPEKENKKYQFPFFNSGLTSKLVLALKGQIMKFWLTTKF